MMPPLAQSDHIHFAGGFYAEVDGTVDYNNTNYIHHAVTKFDTLPGLAIKYGVEVGDIKKMNGLVMDLQMFALPSLRIPLPGRHPSSYSSTCNDTISPSNINLLSPPRLRDSQRKVSSNTINLQQFYELNPQWLRPELDFGSSSFSSTTRKGLSLRPRSASRGSQASHDSEWSSSSSCSGDTSTADAPTNANQSYSYYDQEGNSFSSFWYNTKRRIKIDLQNLAPSTLTKPLLEGPPTRKLKAALD